MQNDVIKNEPPYGREYAALGRLGGPRRFFVSRLGGTGSTWFAKVLNSHPDVFCAHEAVLWFIYPRKTFDVHDHFRFVECVAYDGMHDAYSAIGHVGSTWLDQQGIFPRTWKTGYLMRHPVRTLNSIFRNVAAEGGKFPTVPQSELKEIESLFEVDCAKLDAGDLFFLQNAGVWARAISAVTDFGCADYVFRLEDLNDPDTLQTALKNLTKLTYPDDLILNAIQTRANAREPSGSPIEELFSRFTTRQQRWLIEYVTPFAELAGYEMPRRVQSSNVAIVR